MPGKKKMKGKKKMNKEMKKTMKRLDKEMTPVDEELLKSLKDLLTEMKTRYDSGQWRTTHEICQKLFMKKYIKLIYRVHEMETKLERDKKVSELISKLVFTPVTCEEGESCRFCCEPASYVAYAKDSDGFPDIVCEHCYENEDNGFQTT